MISTDIYFYSSVITIIMDELALKQPEFIGRDEEIDKLKKALYNTIQSKGSTIFISGEAGIGKTRLVSELIKEAKYNDVRIIQAQCLAESLEPLMPIKTALREAKLQYLISGNPPPLVISVYLINEAGILIASAERDESKIDPDIFASMLSAVEAFVGDSLSLMGKSDNGGLNLLGYEKYKILIQRRGKISLVVIIEGEMNEFLIEDMRCTLAEIDDKLDNWSGAESEVLDIEPKISWYTSSGKYNGRFLVDDPKIRQENLFDNILLGLQRASEKKPILLFIDDLQWSDPTTLKLLHYLSRNTRGDRIMILGTYRPEDIVELSDGSPHPLETTIQNMSREALMEIIQLKRLDSKDIKKIVLSSLGKASFDDEFFDKLYRESEGNPFFVLEIVKLLAEEGLMVRDKDGVWKLATEVEELHIPSKVYDVVKRRLNRLKKEQREILECASVIGEEFTTHILERVTGERRIVLLRKLNDIERVHRLIHSFQGKYKFDHAKIREVLYNEIIEELRQEYHRIIGDTIAELHKGNIDEVIGELAYHYYKAGDERAGEYLMRAGDKAKERYANQEAIQAYNNSLSVLKDEKKVEEVLCSLGDVYRISGEYDKAIESYRIALEKEDDYCKKAGIHSKIADAYEKKGEFEEMVEECGKGMDILKGKNCKERATLLSKLARAYMRRGDYDSSIESLIESMRIAEELNEKKEIAQAHHDLGTVYWYKGNYDSAFDHLERALELREDISDIKGQANTLNNIAIVYHDKGEFDRSLEYLKRSLGIMENIGDKYGIAVSLGNIGGVYEDKGELDNAMEYYKRSLKIDEKIGDRWGVAMLLNNIGNVYHNRGDLDDALKYYKRCLRIRQDIGDKYGVAVSLVGIGNVYYDMNNINSALDCFEQSLKICLEIGEKGLSIYAHHGLARVKLKMKDIKDAIENAKNAITTAVEIGAKAQEGKSHHILGMIYREVGEWNNASDEFEKANKILQAVGDKKEIAALFYDYGMLYKSMKELNRARGYLEKAQLMFRKMGMKLWGEKCEDALYELGK